MAWTDKVREEVYQDRVEEGILCQDMAGGIVEVEEAQNKNNEYFVVEAGMDIEEDEVVGHKDIAVAQVVETQKKIFVHHRAQVVAQEVLAVAQGVLVVAQEVLVVAQGVLVVAQEVLSIVEEDQHVECMEEELQVSVHDFPLGKLEQGIVEAQTHHVVCSKPGSSS